MMEYDPLLSRKVGVNTQYSGHHPLGTLKWRTYLAEFVGTCLFMFIVETCMVSTAERPGISPLTTTKGIIYSLGPVSGAHLNPAVSVAAVIAKQLTIFEGIGYIVSQLAGGIAGAAMVLVVHPFARDPHHGALGLLKLGDGIVWQRVLANILAGGPISGACMNPARAIGPILLTNTWDYAYVFIGGPIVGSVLAAIFQLVMFGKNPYLKI